MKVAQAFSGSSVPGHCQRHSKGCVGHYVAGQIGGFHRQPCEWGLIGHPYTDLNHNFITLFLFLRWKILLRNRVINQMNASILRLLHPVFQPVNCIAPVHFSMLVGECDEGAGHLVGLIWPKIRLQPQGVFLPGQIPRLKIDPAPVGYLGPDPGWNRAVAV